MKFATFTLLLAGLFSVHAADYHPSALDGSAPDPQIKCSGYQASNVETGDKKLTATLVLKDSACNVYGSDIQSLSLLVEAQSEKRLHVEIQPTYLSSENSTQYLLNPEYVVKPSGSVALSSSDLEFKWGNDPSFWFQVIRKSDQDVLFDTKGHAFVFENQFVELKLNMRSDAHISGFGDQVHALASEPGWMYTSWNADVGDIKDANLYGTHQFFLETRYSKDGKDAQNHGVYWRNAHGSDTIYNRDQTLTWRFIGGTVDLYFFSGPSALSVTQQYTAAIGLPAMHQYWTLGYHQCAWGYRDWTEILDSIGNYSDRGIPLETQWVDIDYMYWKGDFTVDQGQFRDDYTDKTLGLLHDNHQHFVPIIDAGVYYAPNNERGYTPWRRGADLDVYIKQPDGQYFVGQVWPGDATWIDWTHPSAGNFWTDEFITFHKEMPFDGIWIDMNEPSNFCDGSCGLWGSLPGPVNSGDRNVNDPPYKINNSKGPLNVGTVAPNATYHDGSQHYDLHNIWGYQLLKGTNAAVSATIPGKRPFIIGRSTFAGAGSVAGHWGGDNQATWEAMAYSIPQALKFSLYGIPMFGVDTCGFGGDTTEELCGRWMQLAAFFTFYRNHYATGAVKHEAWRWDSVAEYSKSIMAIRYSLLPYFYTLMQAAHETGDTVLRAVSWEFPQDPTLFTVDTQFMVGSSLMVIPVLQQGATSVSGYLPGENVIWYDWYSQTAVPSSTQAQSFDAPMGHLPLFIRGGSILPQQEPGLTTYKSRQGAWSLLVALDDAKTAAGDLYLDDGVSVENDQVQRVTFAAKAGSLTATVSGSYDFADYDVAPPPLDSIVILGLENFTSTTVQLGGHTVDFSYDPSTHKLVVKNLSDITKAGAWAQSWSLTW